MNLAVFPPIRFRVPAFEMLLLDCGLLGWYVDQCIGVSSYQVGCLENNFVPDVLLSDVDRLSRDGGGCYFVWLQVWQQGIGA